MVQLTSVPELIRSLDEIAGQNSGPDTGFNVISSANIREEAQRLRDLGCWGILPLFSTPEGSSIGLYPHPGLPVSKWPAVSVFETGDGARSLASNIRTLIPCYIVSEFGFLDTREELQESLPALEKIAAFLGGAEAFKVVSEGIKKGKINEANFKIEGYEAADRGSALTEFFRTFHDLIEQGRNALLTWKQFTAKWPEFLPGWKMYLKAGLNDQEVHLSALSAAWKIAKSPFLLDNQYTFEELNYANDLNLLPEGLTDEEVYIRTERIDENTWGEEGTVDESVRLVVNDLQSEEAPGYEPLLINALRKMNFDHNYDGKDHLEAFESLMAAKKFELALHTSRNADYMYQYVNGEHFPESFAAGMEAAKAIGDPHFLEVLKLAD